MSNPTVQPKASGWKARNSVLLFIWLGWMFSFLDRMVMTVSLPFIGADFDLSKTEQGFIISAFFIAYAGFQIPGGFLADKFGPRKVMALAIIWWSIFTSLTGVATSLTVLLIIRFLFGIGEGCFPASSWKAISTYFPSKVRGRATAIQSSVNTLGPALAAIIAAGIIQNFGWHNVFIFLGFPGLVVGFGIWYFIRDNPKEHPGITVQELEELAEEEAEEIKAGVATTEKVPFSTIVRTGALWQMAAIWFLFDITFWGFNSWLPSYLMEARGLSLTKTGFMAALPFLFGTVGTLTGGWASDKFKNGRTWIYAFASVVSAGFLYLTFSVDDLTPAMIFQCISAFFMFFAMGIFWGILMDAISKNIMGTASGIVNFGGQMAGVVSPPIMGYLIQSSGGNYANAFWFMIAALIASAFVTLTVKSKKTEKTA